MSWGGSGCCDWVWWGQCVCIYSIVHTTVWRSVIKSTYQSVCIRNGFLKQLHWVEQVTLHYELAENPWCMHICHILPLLNWFSRLQRSTNSNFSSYPPGYAGCDSSFFWKLSSIWSDSPPWPREPASRRRSNILWQQIFQTLPEEKLPFQHSYPARSFPSAQSKSTTTVPALLIIEY